MPNSISLHSRWPARFVALLLLCLTSSAAARAADGSAARVAYSVETHTESWMPIRQADLEQAVVGTIVEVLAADGRLRLAPLERNARDEPRLELVDLTLEIHIDIVGEAGNASMTLTLRPVRDVRLPSFAGAATASIAKVAKPTMLRRILAATRQAAERVRQAMAPHLLATGEEPTSLALPDLRQLMQWGTLTPPRPKLSGQAMQTLANPRAPRDQRMKAAKELADQAFDNSAVRQLFERLALTDPDPIMRTYAVKYLGPASRKNAFTQQVLLAALRQDQAPLVKREALELTDGFLALSPHQTLQTWVYLLTVRGAELYRYVSGGHNEGPGFEKVAQRLERYLDAPNLDLALSACLLEPEIDKLLLEKRQQACLGLVRQLPPSRHFAVLRPFLDRPLSELREVIRDDRYTDCRNVLDHNEPLGLALQLALHGRCQDVPAAQAITMRLAEESDSPLVSCGLVRLLKQSFPRPALLDFYERVLERERDAFLRTEAVEGVEALARADLSPWGGPLLPRISARLSQVLAQHKEWYGFPPARSDRDRFVKQVPKDEQWQVLVAHNLQGDVLRLLERLKEPAFQAAAKARASLSASDGRPTLAAVAFFTRCLLDVDAAALQEGIEACKQEPRGAACQGSQPRRLWQGARDCLDQLQQLAFFFPQQRQQALAAMLGLLAHPRLQGEPAQPYRSIRRGLEQSVKQLTGMYREGYQLPDPGQRRGYSGGRGPRWLDSRLEAVCLPDP